MIRLKNKLIKALQVSSLGFAGFFTFLSSVEPIGDGILVVITALLGMGAGSTIWLKKDKTNHDQIRILKYITENHGKATLGELMIELEMPVKRTKQMVEVLENHGAISVEVSPTGEIIYCCNDMLTLESRYSTL